MLNIFNLFLFLFMLWVLFMISAGNISWLYLILGIIASSLVAGISYKIKLIDKKSELLYLSFGFYRNFLEIYFKNFYSGLSLISALAFRKEPFKPIIYITKFDKDHHLNLALFATAINMNAGLFCMGLHDDKIFIHAVEKDYFAKLNLKKLMNKLIKANDDNLV